MKLTECHNGICNASLPYMDTTINPNENRHELDISQGIWNTTSTAMLVSQTRSSFSPDFLWGPFFSLASVQRRRVDQLHWLHCVGRVHFCSTFRSCKICSRLQVKLLVFTPIEILIHC